MSHAGTFAAVVTTGIYCRPGCGARPHSENRRRYLLAAAAEADGYRACFQCRPYRWPHTMTWTTPELICRGVRLILDGALDGATEEQLGARLGVSGRHLRRLFTQHLGVTPDGLARSARAHFARRLLDDTDLPMIQIALATGFGSLRQFNRACVEIFHASPRALRAMRRKTDRLVADGGLPLRLAYRGRLDWEALLAYLAVRAIPGVEHVSGSTYRRTIVVDGDVGVLELSSGGDDHLLLVTHLPHWEGLVHLVSRVRRIANLDLDLDEPEDQLGNDPTIGPLLRARPGLRPPGAWDPFETGVRAIIGQQSSVVATNMNMARLVDRCGTRVQGLSEFGLSHSFPSASALAGADLSGLGLPRTRQEAIRTFAGAVADEAIRLDGCMSLDELTASVAAIDGLGAWTAHYVALRVGERDAFPVTNTRLRKVLAPASPRSLGDLGARVDSWRPWRALVATHLWAEDSVRGGALAAVAA